MKHLDEIYLQKRKIKSRIVDIEHFRVSSHLVQLPAEALKNFLLIDQEHGLPFIKDCMHDHAQ